MVGKQSPCFRYHTPFFPLTVHVTAAASACGVSGGVSRKRAGCCSGWKSVSGIHASLSPSPTELKWRQRARPHAASDLRGKCEWGRSVWSLECRVVEVQCSALCFAHIGALLLHSSLSCRVMDLFFAAYGTGCTESAQTGFHSQQKTSECMWTNI